MPTMEGTVLGRRLKDRSPVLKINCIKFKQFGSSGSRRVRIRASRIRDSDPDLNPDPGILDGISPGTGSVSGRWIRPGLRYHQQGPGHNIHWDRTRLAALAKETTKRKNGQYWDREKKGHHQKKDTLAPKKVQIAFAFLLLNLLFSLHLFFL